MRIKLCGITKAEQAEQLGAMRIEFAGFNFYRRSPRYVYKSMPSTAIKKIKGNANKVGIFVNAEPDEVYRAVDDCGLYLVQLHGDESPRYCEKIADYITVIKAFRLSEHEDVLWKIRDYHDVVDMFLFDTESSLYGGSGKKFDWQLLKGLNIRKPFFLGGGIGPGDVAELESFCKDPVAKDLFAVDINSRFELAPGVKDMQLVQQFADSVTKL